MPRPAALHRHVLGALALYSVAAACSGCAEATAPPNNDTTTGAGGSTLTLSIASSSGTGGSGGSGGFGVTGSGGSGGEFCTSTSAKAQSLPVDLVFVIDRSGSMLGAKWQGTTKALTTFFNDPVSAGISAGLVYFPTLKPFGVSCDVDFYKVLDVPVAPLPDNAFALTNSMPATPTGANTPTYSALDGALRAATAYQDAHPTHKVSVVLATDGDPTGCGVVTVPGIASLAQSARDYNGVQTYVIGVEGSIIPNLDLIATAGGTTTYDISQDINQFSAAMAEIRTAVLGCEFGLPPPPAGRELVPDLVNFTYTAGGTDMPVTLPRADDLADCGDMPGWYYDSNITPTKILVCPASCVTVQNDTEAEIAVAFGCSSVLN